MKIRRILCGMGRHNFTDWRPIEGYEAGTAYTRRCQSCPKQQHIAHEHEKYGDGCIIIEWS